MPRAMTARMTKAESQRDLPALGEAGWGANPDRNAIRNIWKSRNSDEAWGSISRASRSDEKPNHHPDGTHVHKPVRIQN